jgi:hypothetical protein
MYAKLEQDHGAYCRLLCIIGSTHATNAAATPAPTAAATTGAARTRPLLYDYDSTSQLFAVRPCVYLFPRPPQPSVVPLRHVRSCLPPLPFAHAPPGLARNAMDVFDRATKAVPKGKAQAEMFDLYIKQVWLWDLSACSALLLLRFMPV